jgi:uncharacterized protein YodC (DUF2158 family)
MFKKLAKSGLVKFWPVLPWRLAPALHAAGLSNRSYGNDNLPGFRRPAATVQRRSRTAALTCHWFDRNGRLECRWQTERAAPIAIDGLDPGPPNRLAFRREATSLAPRRQLSGLAPAVEA